MIISPEIAKAFNLNPGWEAYDNSTLSTIDSCVRKAFWKLLFPLPNRKLPGVAEKVGVAAHYGSAIHSAMDKYYSPMLYHTQTEHRRRMIAYESFSKTYAKLVPDYDMVDEPYTHTSGMRTLADYFDYYQQEDGYFIPIETELCAVVPILELDPPFYWICRVDGVIERPAMQDYLVREFKTTKSGLQNKIDELRISRQPKGYVWGLRQDEFIGPNDKPISGFMADVIAVRVRSAAGDKLFQRDIFAVDPVKAEEWKRQTIIKVARWRHIQQQAELNSAGVTPLFQHQFYDQTTAECMRYGKCSFYELCINGPTNTDLQTLIPNDWNPLYADNPIAA